MVRSSAHDAALIRLIIRQAHGNPPKKQLLIVDVLFFLDKVGHVFSTRIFVSESHYFQTPIDLCLFGISQNSLYTPPSEKFSCFWRGDV